MKKINYIYHNNNCDFSIVKYIEWTKYSTFIPVYTPRKKHHKNYNENQLSLFNLNNEAF